MTNQDFDRLVNSIRDDAPDAEVVRAAADRIWFSRVLAEPRATFVDPEDRDLASTKCDAAKLHQKSRLYSSSASK